MITSQVLEPENILTLPEHTEWVDGHLQEKNGVTFQHSKIQSRLDYFLRSYMISNNLGGEVCVEVPCRTNKQIRRPDVAYITQELLQQFGEFDTLPQSFPLVAEVASPTDLVEDFFAKAEEYLSASCVEVWLIIPKVKYIFVLTENLFLRFKSSEIAKTQAILNGFTVSVDELLN